MDVTVDAPLEWVESITMLRLSEHADKRLQELMDRTNEGQLTDQERADEVLSVVDGAAKTPTRRGGEVFGSWVLHREPRSRWPVLWGPVADR